MSVRSCVGLRLVIVLVHSCFDGNEVADVGGGLPRGFPGAWLDQVRCTRRVARASSAFTHCSRSGVIFIDEHVSQAVKENVPDPDHEVAERTLSDGSTHRLVKVYIEPAPLIGKLEAIGWTSDFVRDGPDWVVGTCRPEGQDHR
jgi:hypothetical protein